MHISIDKTKQAMTRKTKRNPLFYRRRDEHGVDKVIAGCNQLHGDVSFGEYQL